MQGKIIYEAGLPRHGALHRREVCLRLSEDGVKDGDRMEGWDQGQGQGQGQGGTWASNLRSIGDWAGESLGDTRGGER